MRSRLPAGALDTPSWTRWTARQRAATRPSRACWRWRSAARSARALARAASRAGCCCRTPRTTSCSRWSARSWASSAAPCVIGLFLFLAWRGMRVALARARHVRRAARRGHHGAGSRFQAFINIGVVVHLLPLTGITLPFVSSGNSSLLVSFAAVGILLSISRETQSRGTPTMRILVAAGGTGGHIYPALGRPADRWHERRPDLEVRWLGGRRGLESAMVPARGLPARPPLAPDAAHRRRLRGIAARPGPPRRLGAPGDGVPGRWRPDVVYTTGGYVAIPVLTAAAILRIPSLLWEGNRLAGRSVRATARLASVLAVTFPDTAADAAGARLRHRARPSGHSTPADRAGRPRAAAAAARRARDARVRRLPGRVALQSRGGRGAARARARGASLVHVTGEAGFAEAQAGRDRLPASCASAIGRIPFLREEMADALVAADLLVGRAGSSTLAEAAAIGLPVIVVPYPHAAGHQAANARELVGGGRRAAHRRRGVRRRALRRGRRAAVRPGPAATRMRIASRGLGRPGAARVDR